LAVNIPIDFDDEIETRREEKIKTVVAEQQFKRDLFQQLMVQQLPIPPEYIQEYQAYLAMMENPALAAQLAPGAITGLVAPPAAPNMTGVPAQKSDAAVGAQMSPMVNQMAQQQQQTQRGTERQRPAESYEQKESQPKPSKKGPKNGPQRNKKTAGYEDEDLTTSFGDGSIISERVEYGGRMKFATPMESRKRRRMKLASGMRLNVDNSYEKFDEDQFKQHLAALIDSSEESMIPDVTAKPSIDPMGAGNSGGEGDSAADSHHRIKANPENEGGAHEHII